MSWSKPHLFLNFLQSAHSDNRSPNTLQNKFNIGYYVIAVLSVLTIVAIKEIDYFLNPQFRLEDGYVFFADAYNLDFFHSVVQPYGGYFQVIPRIIAEISSILPLIHIPIAYAGIDLILITFCLSWFVLPHFRHVVSSDILRLLLVILLPLTPNSSGQLLIAYLQWYLFVWCLLVSVMNPPKEKWAQIAIYCFYLLTIPTVAIHIILLPIWILRFLYTPSIFQRKWIGSLVLCNFLIVFLLLWGPNRTILSSTLDIRILSNDLFHSLIYKGFVLNLLGYQATTLLFQRWDWFFFYGITLLAIILLAALIWQQRTKKKYLCLYIFLLYITVVSLITFYFTRSRQLNFHFLSDPLSMIVQHSRYFWPASVSSLLMIWIWLDVNWQKSSALSLRRTCLVVGIACLFVIHNKEFSQERWEKGHWSNYAQLITHLTTQSDVTTILQLSPEVIDSPSRNQFNERREILLSAFEKSKFPILYPLPEHSLPIKIPLSSAQWSMNLFIHDPQDKIHVLPEGIIWLGYDQIIESNHLTVSLFWQGNPWLDSINRVSYTAYAHLVDQLNNRVAGMDVLLASIADDVTHQVANRSVHQMPLPADLPEGDYNLVVGLYYFSPTNELKNGSAFLLKDVVKFHNQPSVSTNLN